MVTLVALLLFATTIDDKATLRVRTLPASEVVWDGVSLGLTDAQGILEIEDIPPGTYDVTVRKVGHGEQTRSVRLEGGVEVLDVELEAAAPAPRQPPTREPPPSSRVGAAPPAADAAPDEAERSGATTGGVASEPASTAASARLDTTRPSTDAGGPIAGDAGVPAVAPSGPAPDPAPAVLPSSVGPASAPPPTGRSRLPLLAATAAVGLLALAAVALRRRRVAVPTASGPERHPPVPAWEPRPPDDLLTPPIEKTVAGGSAFLDNLKRREHEADNRGPVRRVDRQTARVIEVEFRPVTDSDESR